MLSKVWQAVVAALAVSAGKVLGQNTIYGIEGGKPFTTPAFNVSGAPLICELERTYCADAPATVFTSFSGPNIDFYGVPVAMNSTTRTVISVLNMSAPAAVTFGYQGPGEYFQNNCKSLLIASCTQEGAPLPPDLPDSFGPYQLVAPFKALGLNLTQPQCCQMFITPCESGADTPINATVSTLFYNPAPGAQTAGQVTVSPNQLVNMLFNSTNPGTAVLGITDGGPAPFYKSCNNGLVVSCSNQLDECTA
ncbi:MAG: hypothetical protein K0R66_765 [Gammaproteobacteria bacterium]|jgi:hypothetical protein|nr:hypothetical protein [Gammaproteobacteria bacterium]